MKPHSSLLLAFTFVLLTSFCSFGQTQKVGIVLSGGGAAGLCHVGVLMALEENGIPIDCITGTSAGALIGSLYAAGYSPLEIKQLILSEEFKLMAQGLYKQSQRFLLREESPDASTISLSFAKDSILNKSLPTNFIESGFLDFEMMRILGVASSVTGNNFDNLFVPFRCVASDIVAKESVVFSKGKLNEAVRASMTFPFYLRPIKIDGKLLFDGGLYNNFPSNVMYQDFNPDYIIGSNVSYNADPPSEDDLISQITNMLVYYTDFSLPCEQGVIIEPNSRLTTFDFESADVAIEEGYRATLKYIDSILPNIKNKVSKEELNAKRADFRRKMRPIRVSEIVIENNPKVNQFIQKSFKLKKKDSLMSYEVLEKRYFRTIATQPIEMLYPLLELKPDSTYKLKLVMSKYKPFTLKAGGHFSSRPVNTGFLELDYRYIGKRAWLFSANSYFGKFYGSVKLEINIDFPGKIPVSLKNYFVMNRWDYFRSFATFFEDVRPSFLIQNEMYIGSEFSTPINNNAESIISVKGFSTEDRYYQTEKFTNKDTSDLTQFQGVNASWEIVHNSLNRKQFATSGLYYSIKALGIIGDERTTPGSTGLSDTTFSKRHKFLNLSAEFRTFPVSNPYFHLGFHGRIVVNSQSLFSNYTATLLSLYDFAPIPDMRTYFLSEFRGPQHIGAGMNIVFSPYKNIDFRIEPYYFQPLVNLIIKEDGTFGYSKPFKGESFLFSTSVVYHTFIGPLRATVNIFPLQNNPINFQISYGYVLFNKRANR